MECEWQWPDKKGVAVSMGYDANKNQNVFLGRMEEAERVPLIAGLEHDPTTRRSGICSAANGCVSG